MTTNIAIEKVFGDGVFQDGNTLVIQKSKLPGIVPSVANTGESLLAAILLLFSQSIKGQITVNSQAISINGDVLTVDNNFAYAVTTQLWDKVLLPENKIRHTFLIYSWSIYGN